MGCGPAFDFLWYNLRMIKKLLSICIILIALAPRYAIADTTETTAAGLTIGIHYWLKVWPGMGQTYSVKLIPPKGGLANVYIVLIIHPDTDVYAVSATDGLLCSEHRQYTTTVICSIDNLASEQIVGVTGTIRGPGDQGVYAILRVGTARDGSPGQGWALDADFHESEPAPTPQGTIPQVAPTATPAVDVAPTGFEVGNEPMHTSVYLPLIEGD